jgi:hypothetical protein
VTTWPCSPRPPRDVTFPARHRLFEDGGSANRFWLVQSGQVTLDLHVPGQGQVRIDTIGMGELLGWSWRLNLPLTHRTRSWPRTPSRRT